MAFSTSPTSAEHVATGRGSRHPVRVGTVRLRFWSTPRHRTRIPGTGILSELSFSSYGAEGCRSIWGHPESILQRNSRTHTLRPCIKPFATWISVCPSMSARVTCRNL
ncbi:hypothetical protein TGDOM2_401660 [Toxoplasma gondii GAB2-2007-GAL-DOM2]|uniref:Uncharacterized protein n=1 Tax=Toxoplasma gondii GAB2-2007-GAL-DOM2 TaxID=1130820 RepID=A0A086JAE5_TOXGO|nr:hypothetical protein TGDOM2_401660 [Toxoplasma gondii GAB2-2007-GAL-DOM2]